MKCLRDLKCDALNKYFAFHFNKIIAYIPNWQNTFCIVVLNWLFIEHCNNLFELSKRNWARNGSICKFVLCNIQFIVIVFFLVQSAGSDNAFDGKCSSSESQTLAAAWKKRTSLFCATTENNSGSQSDNDEVSLDVQLFRHK